MRAVSGGAALAYARPVLHFVDEITQAGRSKSWPRPAAPQLHDLVRVFGVEIHTVLLREKKPVAPLREAQARCEALIAVGQ